MIILRWNRYIVQFQCIPHIFFPGILPNGHNRESRVDAEGQRIKREMTYPLSGEGFLRQLTLECFNASLLSMVIFLIYKYTVELILLFCKVYRYKATGFTEYIYETLSTSSRITMRNTITWLIIYQNKPHGQLSMTLLPLVSRSG